MKLSPRNVFFLLFTVSLLAVMAGPLRALFAYAMDLENKHASQIILIPFITAALIYINRDNIFRKMSYALLPGMLVMALGVGLLAAVPAFGAGLGEGDHLSLIASAIVVLWLGGF